MPGSAAVLDRVRHPGPLEAAFFVLAYAAATLAPVPKNVLSAAAGAVFGTVLGVALVWVAAVLGASVAFWLGRLLGRDAVARLAGRRLDQFDAFVRRQGAASILAVRLIPVVPFTVVNYGSGLTGLRFGSYLIGTGIGILPGTVAFVWLGSAARTPRSWSFSAALALLAAVTLVGALLARRSRRRASGSRSIDRFLPSSRALPSPSPPSAVPRPDPSED